MLLTRDFQRKGSLRWYLVLSALMFGGMYFTNWALNYLNYATRILFKSSKVVPTMALGHVMQVSRAAASAVVPSTPQRLSPHPEPQPPSSEAGSRLYSQDANGLLTLT